MNSYINVEFPSNDIEWESGADTVWGLSAL